MIITASIRKVAQGIIDNDAASTLAMDITNISTTDFSSVAKDLAIDAQFDSLRGYDNTLAMAGLFMSHQTELMKCLDELAYSDDANSIDGYLKSFIESEADVDCFLRLIASPESFKQADQWEKQDCYLVMHTIICHLVRRIAAYYNMQTALNKKLVDSYEQGLAA